MSVQFGTWNFDGKPVDEFYLDRVRSFLSRCGLDGGNTYRRENTAILFHAFHTTKESHREIQPYLLTSGDILCWDGRLDNRDELIGELGGLLSSDSTDLDIVAAANERWGTDCFCKLLGDWALGIWSQRTSRLILAKDFVGIRPLYYYLEHNKLIWSTVLDPLVLFTEQAFKLSEEYVAGWLAFYPAEHLTPYVGIYAVPSCSFVTLGPGKHATKRYWAFDAGKKTFCRTDAEYEEQFRTAFREAVRRRLRADSPITAELSGGMDSSSIVCMADALIDAGAAETPRLDTLSYYDEAEPNWNELPYVRCVEAKRGRVGLHINSGSRRMFNFELRSGTFVVAPPCVDAQTSEVSVRTTGVILSGVGGDEVMGGVPTPIPHLQDLLVSGEFRELAHQLKLWALDQRVPWVHLLFEMLRTFLPSAVAVHRRQRTATWLRGDFVERNRYAFRGYESRTRIFGSSPSFQMNIAALNHLRRQLACSAPACDPQCEKRYPFLDRSLLEFLYSLPRSQLVRAGRRRFLMRRALVGIVPGEILERKRKAFVVRAPIAAITNEWASLSSLCNNMHCAEMGFVDQEQLIETLQKAKMSEEVPVTRIVRTMFTEVWIRNLRRHGIPRKLHTDASVNLGFQDVERLSAE